MCVLNHSIDGVTGYGRGDAERALSYARKSLEHVKIVLGKLLGMGEVCEN